MFRTLWSDVLELKALMRMVSSQEFLPPAEFHGTPKGFWDQQVSSRGIGKDSTEVDGREKVTHMYHQVQNEVKMLRRREGAMASELVCKAPDVDEDAQAIEDRRRIRELFQTIDTDGSGVLEKDEVTELMLKLGTPGLNEEMVRPHPRSSLRDRCCPVVLTPDATGRPRWTR